MHSVCIVLLYFFSETQREKQSQCLCMCVCVCRGEEGVKRGRSGKSEESCSNFHGVKGHISRSSLVNVTKR